MEIHSYRAVFNVERRIYRIDRLRLPPNGVPIRGIVYFVAVAAGLALLAGMPALGLAVRAIPWYGRELLLPGLAASILASLRIDGRPFHLALPALAREARPRRRLSGAGARLECVVPWRPEPLLLLPDGSEAKLRRLRYTGPGTVRVNVAHRREEWRRGFAASWLRADRVVLSGHSRRRLSRPQVVRLAAGASLRVR
jgi:hypothetical protein